MRRLWVAACTVVAASAVLQAGAATEFAARPSSHFFSRADAPLREYRALRRMHGYSENQKHEAWMVASTELKDGQFSYEVVSEDGSDAIRSRVMRAVLAREQEMVNKGEAGRADLTSANYEFTETGRDETGDRVVQIKPRRADVLLVDGRAVLNDNGDLLRVEGKLSKNPSFWTSLVNIVRHYARIGGVRVPVASETTAKVKFVGNAQLDVFYDYQTVNGHPVAFSERHPEALSRTAAR
jgi:hypothetical protein